MNAKKDIYSAKTAHAHVKKWERDRLLDLNNRFEEWVDEAKKAKKTHKVKSVTGFHKYYTKQLDEKVSYAELSGTFSGFIPVLPGKASIKRDFHLAFRQNNKSIEKLIVKKSLLEPTLNYLMSISAGQLIRQPVDVPESKFGKFAIYESIVRNSVFVYVEKEVYEKFKASVKKAKLNNHDFWEVELKGIVFKSLNELSLRMVKNLERFPEINTTGILDELNRLNPIWNILVTKKSGSLKLVSAPRFLDGDIYMQIENAKSGKEQLLTRFLNLSDREELKTMLNLLEEDFEKKHKPNGWIVSDRLDID